MTPDDFLAAHSAQPFVWGEVDCSLILADWLVANGRPDPASALRGTYATEDECRALVARHGGLLPLVTALAGAAGLHRIDEPTAGAIAVIGATTRADRQWGAIWNGRWMVRWTDRLIGFAARPLAMWRV